MQNDNEIIEIYFFSGTGKGDWVWTRNDKPTSIWTNKDKF